MTTILIDNYDSFTWNVYQYLSDLGANVVVFRNDEISIAEIEKLSPRNLVISPGPGKPRDANVSNYAIRHFAGKIPILGVCLGMQCMYELFGGTVTYAGEIVHGKTSPVVHDGRGLYEGLPQNVAITRYHSLAGDLETLPDCLEVTSWCDRLAESTSKIVMGVRHKKFAIEGVQYHPESIASEHGRRMFANFLSWTGGHWDSLAVDRSLVLWDRVGSGAGDDRGVSSRKQTVGSGMSLAAFSKLNLTKNPTKSILETIHQQRLIDVARTQILPGKSTNHLLQSLSLNLAPPQIDFYDRIKQDSDPVAVMAEIKRASPSKGDIDVSIHAPSQALLYSQGGASVISVLTEPKWFKGDLEDLRNVRAALDLIPNRPAILRKDFIIDQYQILEARLYGADSLLLIVAILSDSLLLKLLEYSRQLGMEPLVEVANEAEMKRALACNSRIIGVNNRDLHSFKVDMNRTSSLSGMVSNPDVILVALSGITSRADVVNFVQSGAKAVLVGEALMRSKNQAAFVRELKGLSIVQEPEIPETPLVKICGITNVEDAVQVFKLGAHMLGLIFAPSARQVSVKKAKEVVQAVKSQFGIATGGSRLAFKSDNFHDSAQQLRKLVQEKKILFVGVFSNKTVAEINKIVDQVELDLVQFHGDEEAHLAKLVHCPVIKAFHVMPDDTVASLKSRISSCSGTIALPLLDTGIKDQKQQGGSGVAFNWNLAQELEFPFILAGGINKENVQEARKLVKPFCIDVCGGVEKEKGKKDFKKVEDLIRNFLS